MGFPQGPDAERARIWMDGEMVPWKDANIHVMSHALHYGSGVFEGIRAYDAEGGTAIFRLKEHIDRFFLSAKVYGMDLGFTHDELFQACRKVVRDNELASAYVRPIAFYGYGKLGVYPSGLPVNVAIGAWEWGAYLGEEALEKGVRVALSPWRRIQPDALPVNAKACGQYLSGILGAMSVKANGFHEALFLDTHGHVSEGGGENIFLVKDNVLFTPASASSILEGITRDSVIKIARGLGYEVIEKTLVMGEVFGADEAFFTGTAAEVTPIAEVEHRTIGEGKPGPVTKAIQTAYFDAVMGRSDAHGSWLTRVN